MLGGGTQDLGAHLLRRGMSCVAGHHRAAVWLMSCGGRDVGLAVLEERPDHLLLYSIAVTPTEQGRGHGGALLDFADQRAAALAVAEIRLYTNARMVDNIAFYRRHGYSETGTRPHPSRAGEMLVDMVRFVPPLVPDR